MELKQINSIAETIADDYGFDGVDSVEKTNSEQAQVIFIANNTTKLAVDIDFASKNIRKAILKALVKAYDNYDPQDEIEQQLSISADTIDYINRVNDNDETNKKTQSLITNEIENVKPLSSFQDNLMDKIDADAQMMHREAYTYQRLPLMKGYVRNMYYFSRSEGLYRELQKVLDTKAPAVHTFLYEPNFFSFIATEQGEKAIDLFEAGHHAEAVNQVLEYNYQLTRKEA